MQNFDNSVNMNKSQKTHTYVNNKPQAPVHIPSKSEIIKQQKIEDESKYNFTITHFSESANKADNVVSKPTLGRMKLWESMDPIKNMEDVLKTMRHATFVTLPLMFIKKPAFAAGLSDLSAGDVADAASKAAPKAAQSYVTM